VTGVSRACLTEAEGACPERSRRVHPDAGTPASPPASVDRQQV